jgi:arsenite-transporting ATPase
MVIKETQRFYTYLNLYGYLTDMVICNRVLPDSVEGGYFKSWRVSHEKHMNSIFEAFSPLPITTVPLLKQEPVGLATLGEVGKILYGKRDPAEFFSHRNAQQISKTNGHYNLFIDLPTAKKEEVGLLREGDELVVNVGKYRRNIILPRALAKAEIKRAAFKNDRLQIEFDGARKATTA